MKVHIIVCVDDRGGMTFGGRRQSRDRVLYTYLSDKYKNINITAFSQAVFEGGTVCDTLTDGVCFVENIPPSSFKNVDTVTLCRWNRRYPADMYFDIDLNDYTLISQEDIVGSSHEKITIEEYIRKRDGSLC